MLLVAAACRCCVALLPVLGRLPIAAKLAAGLTGSCWQVVAPIVGVGVFRPLQQQVRGGQAWATVMLHRLPTWV